MPVPAQATLYDKKGIPIAVDPRIPGLTRVTPKSIQGPPSRPDSSDRLPTEFNRDASTTTAKRNASDDPQDDLGKRVKSDHKPFVLESPATITAPPPTPVSASPIQFARATAGDFMAECVANGITLTPAETSASRLSNASTCPPWPLEAIETLRQVSTDLLLALVRKGADDRERQLQVAVGTLRTCLDVDFFPHMDAWKADAEAKTCQSTTPLSAVLASLKPHLPSSIPQVSALSASSPKEPESGTPVAFGVPPSREVLRKQLAGARATLEKQASDLKQKDDEIARTKEENKRLNARLSQLSSQASQSTKPSSTSAAKLNELKTMHRTLGEQTKKLNEQRSQLASLNYHNGRYRDMLKAAGIPTAHVKGEDHGGQSSNVKGGAKHQDTDKPTWKEVWETKGQHKSIRIGSGGHRSVSGSGASSVLATPMIETDSRPPSENSRKSGSYDFNSLGSEGGGNRTDSRSDWERSVAETKIGPPSPKGVARVPTGPRHPSRKVESGESSGQTAKPRYVSENGWGDYYSKDGFGGMQADRLDFE